MGNLGAFMAVSSISSAGTAYAQSQAIRSAGDYKSTIAGVNAKIANLQAEETIDVGNAAASREALKARSVAGSLRAAQGASGTDVSGGSNALTRIGADFAGKIDELTIRNNAARRAWGFKTQAMQDTFEGQMERITANSKAQQTLITGGLDAIEKPLGIYARYKYRGQRSGSTKEPFDLTTTDFDWSTT